MNLDCSVKRYNKLPETNWNSFKPRDHVYCYMEKKADDSIKVRHTPLYCRYPALRYIYSVFSNGIRSSAVYSSEIQIR